MWAQSSKDLLTPKSLRFTVSERLMPIRWHILQDKPMTRKCIVQWFIDDDGEPRWRCGKYQMSSVTKFRATSEKCYHYMCPGRRADGLKVCKADTCAEIVLDPDKAYCPTCEISNRRVCKTEGCTEYVKPPKRNHCSDRCRQVDKSRAYRARKAKNVSH